MLTLENWARRSVNSYHHYQSDIIGGLSKLGGDKIDRVIEVLECLAPSPSVSRYALMAHPAELRKMLTAGKASGCEKTRRRVDRIANVVAPKRCGLVHQSP